MVDCCCLAVAAAGEPPQIVGAVEFEAYRPCLRSGHRRPELGWSGTVRAPMADLDTAVAFLSSCTGHRHAGRCAASSGRRRRRCRSFSSCRSSETGQSSVVGCHFGLFSSCSWPRTLIFADLNCIGISSLRLGSQTFC